MASAVRGRRITEHGPERVADPSRRRLHRRVALRIAAWSALLAAAATAGLVVLGG